MTAILALAVGCSSTTSGSATSTDSNTLPTLPNAGTGYVTNFESNSVSVIAPGATTASTVAVGSKPADVAVAPAGTPNVGSIYVASGGATDKGNGSVSVIAPGAPTVSTVSVGSSPLV